LPAVEGATIPADSGSSSQSCRADYAAASVLHRKSKADACLRRSPAQDAEPRHGSELVNV